MLYLAYNLFYYKKEETELFKKKVKSIVQKHLDDKDIIYPYSKNTIKDLELKIKSPLTGVFLKDIRIIIEKCDVLAILPTEENFIGFGIYCEYIIAKKNKLKIIAYNQKEKKFSSNFKILNFKNKNLCFNKKIIFK